MRESWRERAKATIKECFEIWGDHNGYLPSHTMPEAEKVRFLAMVDRAYPFGQRRMHPYKIWLSERKRLHAWIHWKPGMPKVGLSKTVKRQIEESATPSLFEESA